MATLLLVRHGLTEMTGPVLAGWTPEVHLNERGRTQAAELAARLAPVPLDLVVASPLDRCQETAQAVVAGRDGLQVQTDDRFGEVRYGDWTGRPLEELAKEDLWKVVQAHPSAVRFPGGEAMADAQHRAVTAVREWNDGLKPDATFLVCSHGDIIKSIVADALGLHLDQFQRIQADPASVTVIRYTEMRPFVVRLNDNGGKVDDLLAKSGQDSDAPVGGGA
ncbi:putative phosphoglycerate mutase [Actinoallomurus bryophytorum]|uniref:Putative phosphoglycerate mutase n=1 Tax=Actinoallomurus bryophytorum TaxID=1490222 RepID=A0A543CX68_9ACTN|nr:histidine phosphatase family protein [Actinoallomurus bryophytorum]TQM01458.1 putative phosphoglycerate mutase [Actinoallomurus bryophytorum]